MSHSVHVHVFVSARGCACVGLCVINENKHPFQDFRYLIHCVLLIYPTDFSNLCHVGLFASICMHM